MFWDLVMAVVFANVNLIHLVMDNILTLKPKICSSDVSSTGKHPSKGFKNFHVTLYGPKITSVNCKHTSMPLAIKCVSASGITFGHF